MATTTRTAAPRKRTSSTRAAAAVAVRTEPRWLTEDEQRSWRAWLSSMSLLQERLEQDMKVAHGLSMAEYEVMVRLSEAPGRRLRMSELAGRTLSSKSRLSHQVTRMEEAGLVMREECEDDRRGFWAVLTEVGWERLVEAAPDHVESVRHWLVDVLGQEDFARLGALCATVVDHIQSGSEGTGTGTGT